MKIGSLCFIRKTLVRSKRKQPAGSTRSRCFPNPSPFFLPKCVFSAYSKNCHDPLLFIHAQLQISKPAISLSFSFLNLSILWSVNLFKKTMLCFGKNLILIVFIVHRVVAGLAVCLKGQFVNNFKPTHRPRNFGNNHATTMNLQHSLEVGNNCQCLEWWNYSWNRKWLYCTCGVTFQRDNLIFVL